MRKKVGIITMHRVVNYGSFLQAYATQEIVKKLGYECEIIDYQFPNSSHVQKTKKSLIGVIKSICHALKLTPSSRKKEKFLNTISRNLNLSTTSYLLPEDLLSNPPLYDIYLTGSDQTFNPRHTKFDTSFLLEFAPKEAKRVAFSASLSGKEIEEKYHSLYKEHLSKYTHISLREQSSIRLIEKLSGVRPDVTIDPSLLLSKEEWEDAFPINKYKGEKFILFYLITHSFDPAPYIYEYLKYLQNKTNLPIYSLTKIDSIYNIKYKNLSASGIDDFISLFSNAHSVVTSSFHGTAFSINFGVPVYSIVPKEINDSRQVDLLKSVSLEESIVYIGDTFKVVEKVVKQEPFHVIKQDSINKLKQMLDS